MLVNEYILKSAMPYHILSLMGAHVWNLAIFLSLLILLSRSEKESPPPCLVELQGLIPCDDYVNGNTDNVSPSCCSGMESIDNVTKSNADIQALCECIQTALPYLGSSYDPNRLPLLPQKCNVSIVIPPIKADTDCNQVTMPGDHGDDVMLVL